MRSFIENERIKPLFTDGEPNQVSTAIKDRIYYDGFYYYRDVLNTKEDIFQKRISETKSQKI